MSFKKFKRLKTTQQSEICNNVASFLMTLPESPEVILARRAALKKVTFSRECTPSAKAAAIALYFEVEESNKATNARIRSGQLSADTQTIISMAARKIGQILGDFDIDEVLAECRFGPGSTYSVSGKDVSLPRKLEARDVTGEFQQLAACLLAAFPAYLENLTDSVESCPILSIVPGTKLTTVLKDTEIARTISSEPTINSFFQQGMGRVIRKRLWRNAAVNLNDNSLNKRLAHLGSLTDDIATVDLKTASDRVVKLLVRELLSYGCDRRWFEMLDITRSKRVKHEGKWYELEKFSAMGNGFTFDLESLIFYALTWAVTVKEGYNPFWVNVFGDDIVCPSGIEGRLKEVFSEIGFVINQDKSYFRGPFRESCGHDYYLGQNIRSFYIKKLVNDVDVIKVHNRIYEWGNRLEIDVSGLLKKILSCAHHLRKFRCPPWAGDMGFHGSFEEIQPPMDHTNPTYEATFRFKVLSVVLMTTEKACRSMLVARIARLSSFQRNKVTLREDPIGYREQELLAPFSPPTLANSFLP